MATMPRIIRQSPPDVRAFVTHQRKELDKLRAKIAKLEFKEIDFRSEIKRLKSEVKKADELLQSPLGKLAALPTYQKRNVMRIIKDALEQVKPSASAK